MFKLPYRWLSTAHLKGLHCSDRCKRKSFPMGNCKSASLDSHVESTTVLLGMSQRVNEVRVMKSLQYTASKKIKFSLRFDITKAVGNEYWHFSIWNLIRQRLKINSSSRVLQSSPQGSEWRAKPVFGNSFARAWSCCMQANSLLYLTYYSSRIRCK